MFACLFFLAVGGKLRLSAAPLSCRSEAERERLVQALALVLGFNPLSRCLRSFQTVPLGLSSRVSRGTLGSKGATRR
jgi:hypothetical protein